MGMQALPTYDVPGIGNRLQEEWEGEVVGKNGAFVHVGVDREGDLRGVGVREGSDEGVADENMGFGDLG